MTADDCFYVVDITEVVNSSLGIYFADDYNQTDNFGLFFPTENVVGFRVEETVAHFDRVVHKKVYQTFIVVNKIVDFKIVDFLDNFSLYLDNFLSDSKTTGQGIFFGYSFLHLAVDCISYSDMVPFVVDDFFDNLHNFVHRCYEDFVATVLEN